MFFRKTGGIKFIFNNKSLLWVLVFLLLFNFSKASDIVIDGEEEIKATENQEEIEIKDNLEEKQKENKNNQETIQSEEILEEISNNEVNVVLNENDISIEEDQKQGNENDKINEEKDQENGEVEEVESLDAEDVENEEKDYFKIVINEVAWMGTTESYADEWIELKNLSEEKVSLENWSLEIGSKKIKLKGEIGKKGFYLLERTDDNSALGVEADLIYTGNLNNNGEVLILRNTEDRIIDKIDAGEKWLAGDNNQKLTMERMENGDWQDSFIVNGTPKKENSKKDDGEENGGEDDLPELKNYSEKLEITEILPNPEGVDKDKEWLELFNGDLLEIDLRGWYLINQSNRKFKLDGLKIKSQERLKIEIKNTSFSIKNSDGWIELRNPNKEEVDKVAYAESAKTNTSYNKKANNQWEWSIFTTPGQENKFNNPPTYKVNIPDKIYENVKVFFEIEKVEDKDGEVLKFRWDFGNGKKSYLKKTSHKFDKRGRYTIQTRVSDLSVDVFKYFDIEVQKFPDFDLKIVKLLPNPKGSDSENEKIWILNKEKRTVNLKGWSITTGSSMSKLTNHYFKEDFKIKAGDIKEIGRRDCPFSLLNKKGRVVLKAPSGDVIDKVKYQKDKIENDEIYYLEEGNWLWQSPVKEFDQKAESSEAVVLGKKDQSSRKDLIRLILDENKYDGSKKLVYFNNWLFVQSRNYFFDFIFPKNLVKRIKT